MSDLTKIYKLCVKHQHKLDTSEALCNRLERLYSYFCTARYENFWRLGTAFYTPPPLISSTTGIVCSDMCELEDFSGTAKPC